ncbi:MAG TPA: PilN domain-containing protein [Bryobacteraceae bacterium]|nr:PilN domain-containing protein [Bryobacteraceae bacterium]
MSAPASPEIQPAPAPARSAPADIKKFLAFGSSIGIEIAAEDLEVTAVRVRPARIQVAGHATIANFAARPAGEWGAEYLAFLKSLAMAHVSATVLLPRREVIVRQLALPGVARRDRASAIRLQLETLHPYGDDEISWDWTPIGENAVLVGIARREAIERYVRLFAEAGIAVASFTFSAAAIHAALRAAGRPLVTTHGTAIPGFLALRRSGPASVEAYGESAARPVFSAEFQLPPERAAILALSELRLPPETAPLSLEEVLPQPAENPVSHDLSRNALPYAAALAGACPWLARAANVLPAEHRRSSSRAIFIPTIVLAVLAIAALAAVAVYSHFADRRYLRDLQAEIAKIEPLAQRAAALDREIDQTRARARLLDQFRSQTRADLDALQELTKLIAPPAWSSSINLTRDQARITGEAPQAAPLLRIIDASPLFENSEFLGIGKGNGTETFQLRANREKHP